MGKRVSLPSVDLHYIEFAQHPVYSPYSFVVQHQQRDPAVKDRDLDGVVGQDQLEVVVFHGITELPVALVGNNENGTKNNKGGSFWVEKEIGVCFESLSSRR